MDLLEINWIKDGKYRILVLKILNKKNLLSSELADELNVNRASMSRILKAMDNKGFVKSSKGDSRTVTYSITKKGLKVLQEVEND